MPFQAMLLTVPRHKKMYTGYPLKDRITLLQDVHKLMEDKGAERRILKETGPLV